jgi:hypothetical protein
VSCFSFFFELFKGRGCAYTYDLGITPVRSQAGGCLTTKNIV